MGSKPCPSKGVIRVCEPSPELKRLSQDSTFSQEIEEKGQVPLHPIAQELDHYQGDGRAGFKSPLCLIWSGDLNPHLLRQSSNTRLWGILGGTVSISLDEVVSFYMSQKERVRITL